MRDVTGQIDDISRTAHLMADAARAAILPFFRSPTLDQDNKEDGGYDPVTAFYAASPGGLSRPGPTWSYVAERG